MPRKPSPRGVERDAKQAREESVKRSQKTIRRFDKMAPGLSSEQIRNAFHEGFNRHSGGQGRVQEAVLGQGLQAVGMS